MKNKINGLLYNVNNLINNLLKNKTRIGKWKKYGLLYNVNNLLNNYVVM